MSVDASHERSIWWQSTMAATRPVGIEGAVVSGGSVVVVVGATVVVVAQAPVAAVAIALIPETLPALSNADTA